MLACQPVCVPSTLNAAVRRMVCVLFVNVIDQINGEARLARDVKLVK